MVICFMRRILALLSEYCEHEGFEEEDFMEMDKLKVGESVYDGASAIYTRIW